MSLPIDFSQWVIDAYDATGYQVQGQFFVYPSVMFSGQFPQVWQVHHGEELVGEALTTLLAPQPELVLLATGETRIPLSDQLIAQFIPFRVGLEVMATGAACRTWNIVMQEQRPATIAFLPW